MDVKEIKDIVTDSLDKNLGVIRKELADGNQKTVADVDAALEKARKSTEEIVSTAKTQLQKDYDQFVLAIKEAQEEGKKNQKPLSFGQAFAKTMKEGGFDGIQTALKSGKIDHIMEIKAFGTAQFTDYEAFDTEYQPIITNLYDQFHWRNLLPNAATSKEFISFPKQGTTTGAPGPWNYGANPGATVTKPVITPTITPYTAKVEWIAGIIKHIEVSMLEDFGWATTFLSNLLREELLKAEDNQILNGNGTSPQLDGLLNNSVAYDGDYTVGIEKIMDAAWRQLGDQYMTPNAIVMSNADKVGIILNKADTSGEYNLPAGAIGYVNGRLTFDGLPIYTTPQMSPGQALVGDFNQAVLAIRSAPRLRIFDQNEDDATKNYLMMRIEERVALAIRRAGAFVEINFSAS